MWGFIIEIVRLQTRFPLTDRPVWLDFRDAFIDSTVHICSVPPEPDPVLEILHLHPSDPHKGKCQSHSELVILVSEHHAV